MGTFGLKVRIALKCGCSAYYSNPVSRPEGEFPLMLLVDEGTLEECEQHNSNKVDLTPESTLHR